MRLAPTFSGDTAAHWVATVPTPGSVDFSGGVLGDFTGDGLVNGADIDRLQDQVRDGSHVSFYDLDGSIIVDQADVDHLVQNVLATNLGDANLDGAVNALDFNVWNTHHFQSCTDWSAADFNGDGKTDIRDFNLWNQNKFLSVSATGPTVSRAPRAALADGEPVTSLVLLAELGTTFADELETTDRDESSSVRETIDRVEGQAPMVNDWMESDWREPVCSRPTTRPESAARASNDKLRLDALEMLFAKFDMWN